MKRLALQRCKTCWHKKVLLSGDIYCKFGVSQCIHLKTDNNCLRPGDNFDLVRGGDKLCLPLCKG